MATATATCNRMLSAARLGQVVKVEWKPAGIQKMYMRIHNVNLGDLASGIVTLDLIEDVYGMDKTEFGSDSSTNFVKEKQYPTGVQDFTYFELPYELRQTLDTYVFAVAARPDILTEIWNIWRKAENDAAFAVRNSLSKWTPVGTLLYDCGEFDESEDLAGLTVTDGQGIDDMKREMYTGETGNIEIARRGGRILLLGDELISYSGLKLLSNGDWQITGILRGVYDTVPQNHTAGDIVYFLQSGHYGNVAGGGPVCLQGSTTIENYNITTATIASQEDFSDMKIKSPETVRRAERPTVQGRIRMSYHLRNEVIHATKISGDLTLSWTARDKFTKSDEKAL